MQIEAYNKMLDYVNNRICSKRVVQKYGRPDKVFIHEKEREFFDALRLIIQNGYELIPQDIYDILNFIKIEELIYFTESE